MAEEIRQVISLDTSGAISNADKLNEALGRLSTGFTNFASNLSKLGTGAQQLNLKNVADQFKEIATAASKLGRSNAASGLRNTATAAQAVGLRGKEAESAMNSLVGATNQPIGSGFQRFVTTLQQIAAAGNTSGSAFQRASAVIQAAFNRIRGAATSATARINAFRTSGQKIGVPPGLNSLAKAFSNFNRVIATQAIVTTFSRFRQAVRESITDQIDFVRQIREVVTILPDVNVNVEQLSNSVRQLSDNFNIPLGQVTEGLYQAVSNQIGDAAQSLQFLETASKFARGAVASLDESVLLLSGALNAFNKDVSEASTVAAKFFTTIRLGRTRASELAQSFGRVAPIASQIGVTFDELNAAFASTTIAGIKTSEATTQIRGALNALLKPTEATKDLLYELGFSSGEALIQARGLQGALQTLRDATGGSITRFSEFIPRVRGMNFALLSTSKDGAESFNNALRQIQQTQAELLEETFEIVVETNAEKVAREANKLKNIFTVEIGESIVNTLARLLNFVGGVDSLAIAIQTLISPVTVGIGLFGSFAASAFLAVTALNALKLSSNAAAVSLSRLAPFAIAASVALGAFLVGDFISRKILASIDEANEKLDTLAKKRAENAAALVQTERQQEALITRELTKAVGERVAEFQKGTNQRLQIARDAYQKERDLEDQTVKAILSAREEILQKTREQARVQTEAARTANNQALDASQRLEDFQFDRGQRRFNQLQQFSNLQSRANDQALQAAQQYSRAIASGSEDDIESARAALDRAQSTQESALNLADQLGNRTAINQAEQATANLLQREVDLENSLANASERRAEDAKRQADAQQQQLARLKELARVALGADDLFDPQGRPITNLAEQSRIRSEALRQFKQEALKGDVSISDIINISQLSTDIDKQLSTVQVKEFFVSDAAARARSEIEATLSDFQLEFKALITSLELAQGITIGTPEELTQALQTNIDLTQKITDNAAQTAKENTLIRERIDGIRKSLEGAVGDMVNFTTVTRTGVTQVARLLTGTETTFGSANFERMQELAQVMNQIVTAIERGKEPSDALLKRFQNLIQLADEAQAGRRLDLGTQIGTTEISKQAERLLELFQLIEQARQRRQQFSESLPTGNLEQQTRASNILSQDLTDAAGAAAKKVQEEAQSVQLAQQQQSLYQNLANSLIDGGQQFRQDIEQAAQAINSIQPIPIDQKLGGPIRRFSSGGMAKGTDTIPAMLSPGEFVVNARSTRRFFSQLQAINSGRMPIYRQDGGPVPAQTTIGDINVTVNGAGKTGEQTGRQIARSLRRELRRNTSTL